MTATDDADTPEPADVINDLVDQMFTLADRPVRPLPSAEELARMRRADQ